MELNSSCPVSADGALTAGATETSGANQRASLSAAAAMENSPTEKQRKNKKNGIHAFFRRGWQAVKCVDRSHHRSNRVAPLQPETDAADPQQALSGLQSTAVQDPADPQPDPVSSTCGLKPTSDTDPAGPEPAKEKQRKNKKIGIRAFFRRGWQAVKCVDCCRRRSKRVAPLQPETDAADPQQALSGLQSTAVQDLADPQPGPSGLQSTAVRDLFDPQPGPSGLQSTALQDPTDPQPGPSGLQSTAVRDPFDPQPGPSGLQSTAVRDLFDPQPGPSGLQSTAVRDLFDPQPGPSGLQSTAVRDLFDPQPGPSGLQSTALQDPTDPQPGPSGLQSTAVRDLFDPQPGPSGLQSTALQDPTTPQPDPVPTTCGLKSTSDTDPAGPEPAKEPQPKANNKGIFAFLRRTLRPMKCAKKRSKKNKVDPVASQPNTDSAEPQAGPSEAVALKNPDDPPSEQHPFSSVCNYAADLQNPGQSDPDQDPVSFASLYKLGQKISAGGFGTVFRGIRKADRLQVAIKLIPKRDTDQYIAMDGYSNPLLMEVALNLLLKKAPFSPNIVYILEWFEEKDQHILILEYPRPCLNLKTILKYNDYKLTEIQARGLLVQAVHAAKHCMNQGIFHRDLKLNNLLLNTNTMQVKLIDFGCGDLVKDSGYQNEFRGRHRPPEFYMRNKYHAGPTTVWSLGLMLFQMVTGRPAFGIKDDIISGDLTFDSSLSGECQDVISQCLIRDPDKRVTLERLLDHTWFQQEDDPAVAQESGGVT